MNVLGNLMNWDPVLWLSILMVILAMAVFVFLVFKIKSLMNRDAELHGRQD